MNIFERELAGEVIDPETDPEFGQFLAVQRRSYELTHQLNTLPYLGDNVQIAPKDNLVTLNHDLSAGGNRKATYCKPIVIEDNVWIGINSTILPGVTLGKNCVVAAGSVVTKDVPADTIVAGNPAKIVKQMKTGNCVRNGEHRRTSYE